RPIVFTYDFSPSTPRSRIACGVFATGKSFAVALFTPTSVACAERMTATSSSKGVEYSSSVVGSGLASRRRLKISARLVLFMGRMDRIVQDLQDRKLSFFIPLRLERPEPRGRVPRAAGRCRS